MSRGVALRQAYLGRVIRPADIKEFDNGGMILNFELIVDGLVRVGQKREQGRLYCSYSVKGDPLKDRAVVILANILNSQTGDGSLAGQTYKSVDVLVEGIPELTPVKDGKGFYLNLKNTTISVVDDEVLALYRMQVEGMEVQEAPEVAPEPMLEEQVMVAEEPAPWVEEVVEEVPVRSVAEVQQQVASMRAQRPAAVQQRATTAAQNVASQSQVLSTGARNARPVAVMQRTAPPAQPVQQPQVATVATRAPAAVRPATKAAQSVKDLLTQSAPNVDRDNPLA